MSVLDRCDITTSIRADLRHGASGPKGVSSSRSEMEVPMTASHTDPCPTPAARKVAPFSNRAAAVFLVGLAFLVMVPSGLVVMIAPSGRIAADLGWSLLGLSRPQWELIHLATGFVFTGAGIWHIWLHWSVIRNLLWSAAARTLCHRRELALALGLVGVTVLLAVLSWPPISWLEHLASWFRRDFW
jgi:hypothetical protein